ncbi:hypothetical protein Pla110_33180 [Polystyrenella longa]|uniref:Uncharacterized protein n=1 Tax=Polystyrenella longa TaxID=2528007 RepID=A0A518CQS0_9PLAN|nr:hypothetical protein [Polystyrenella longa]QDU81576.1 hypothetical protein Pla110_33180 [Polystyrenella longa]
MPDQTIELITIIIASLTILASFIWTTISHRRLMDKTDALTKRFIESCQQRLDLEYNTLSLKSLTFQAVGNMYYIHLPSDKKATHFPDGIVKVSIYKTYDGFMQINDTMAAINLCAIEFGFEVVEIFPAVHGSWWQRFLWKAKNSDAVVDRLNKMERAIEMQGLFLPQSQADKNLLEGAAAFRNSLNNDEGIVLVGSVLLLRLRTGGDSFLTITKSLTQKQLIFLEKNPMLLESPNKILDALGDAENESDDGGDIIHRL